MNLSCMYEDDGRLTRTSVTQKWCVKFNGMHMFVVLQMLPKMSYREIANVILNEGGIIDDKGFISSNGVDDELVKY